MTDSIRFLKVNHVFGFMSNFYPAPTLFNDFLYPTNEHFYQSIKFRGTPHEITVREAPNAWMAMKWGRDSNFPLIQNWEVVKDDVMRFTVMTKFIQNPDIQEQLVDTGEAILIEHGKHDKYWADGGDGSGQNRLGLILMEVREMFKLGLFEVLHYATWHMQEIEKAAGVRLT